MTRAQGGAWTPITTLPKFLGVGVALPRAEPAAEEELEWGGKEQQSQFPGHPERPTGRTQAPWKPPATPARPVLVLWDHCQDYLNLIMFCIRRMELFLFARLSTQG